MLFTKGAAAILFVLTGSWLTTAAMIGYHETRHLRSQISKRDAAWVQSKWVKGGTSLAVGALVQGTDAYDKVINSCVQQKEEGGQETQAHCVVNALLLLGKVVLSSSGAYTIGAAVYAGQQGYVTGRKRGVEALAVPAVNATLPYEVTAVNYIGQADNLTVAVEGHYFGTSVIQTITNGTTSVAFGDDESGNQIVKRGGDVFYFGPAAGIKMTAWVPCARENQFLRNAVAIQAPWTDFVYWSMFNRQSDAYEYELTLTNDNEATALGKIVFESGGFGANFEAVAGPFNGRCGGAHDEL
ncbi:hypothetical protein K461DRAFT_272208 [Myriangium duriaei CBS 260.36]|uniref:Uncharacterized protein n=1 Tax=Myriangium duriaei CBS 260.36 TaxID=1168546 RepID=A0A9P4IT39_9PEZI|nr:hypothetical protein K461DRAFT_272208 [Myriangium duriaei CBS 260.36]